MAGRTFSTASPTNIGQREDLANFISMISRDETPFLSSIGKTKATAIFHEWQTDELATPKSAAVAEGVSYSTQASAQVAEPVRSRLGNYTQINSKTVTVTGTKRAVDQAGVADEYAYQLKKRGTELRRDVEFDMIQAWNNSNGSGTRTFGGYEAWANVNVVDASGGIYAAPATKGIGTAGVLTAASGTEAALSLSSIDSLMQTIYEAGGKATKLMTSPANRRAFSARAQAAGSASSNAGDGNVRRNIDADGKLRQSVEIYMSDFGDIMVVPNYIMGLSHTVDDVDVKDFTALVYDPQWFAYAALRPMQEVELGQMGDSIIGQIVEEGSLECRNPAGCGMVVGLSGA
jgi:hypothetical protein